MWYDAPWGIAKGHHHLATPELNRWKAAQQAFAAVTPKPSCTLKWILELKTATLIIGKGLNIFLTASKWSTTWFSAYWWQRIAATVTATNASFIGRVLNADAAMACGGPKANRPSRFPKYHFYDPVQARDSMVPSLPARCSH